MIRVWKSQVEVISGKGGKCKGFIIELGKTALFFFFFFLYVTFQDILEEMIEFSLEK